MDRRAEETIPRLKDSLAHLVQLKVTGTRLKKYFLLSRSAESIKRVNMLIITKTAYMRQGLKFHVFHTACVSLQRLSDN